MPFLQRSDSLSIFYTAQGDSRNPPVLLMHGWTCDSHDWSWQIPLLEKSYYVIAFDLRGHGRSSAPKDISFRVTDFVSDAVALLHHLGIKENVLVMGHSFGGVTASYLAAMEPQMVKAIVLLDPPYFQSNDIVHMTLQEFEKPTTDIHKLANTFLSYVIPATVPDFLRTWYTRRVLATPEHVVAGTYIDNWEIGGPARESVHLASGAEKRACPRLVIMADQDWYEKERALGVGELDEVLFIEGYGHWPHHVKDKEFNDILVKWLAKLDSAK